MTYPRPSARTSSVVLLALLIVSAFAAPAVFASGPGSWPPEFVGDPNVLCSPNQKPTQWKDDVHPPTTIRVLRSKGPNTGHVETVNFWDYVAVVMRAEYSKGGDKPPVWMQVGAIVVKEYGWYKTMFWGGGRVSFTNSTTGTTTTECYDVKDTTADQIYKPGQWDGVQCIKDSGNCPTPNIEVALAQTWHMSMRKWNADKNLTRIFLSGYRSGQSASCGTDSSGFKIYQKSLFDCVTKKLTLEETLREYFDPVYLVNTREHDSLSDSGGWWGDLPVLSASGGNTAWSVSPGKADGFGAPVTGTFTVPFSSIVGYDTGNVETPVGGYNGTGAYVNRDAMYSDLVLVTNGAVRVAHSDGTGFGNSFTDTTFGGGVDKVVFGDFDGDMLMDVGLLKANGDHSASTLSVMKAKGDDTFDAPVQVWTGEDLTLSSVFVAAGDVNGDGKADLVTRDAAGNFNTAVSPPSCSSHTLGTCPAGSVGPFALGLLTPALADPGGLSNSKIAVGDYNRDGRDDVLALVAGSPSVVYGMLAQSGGGFSSKNQLWSSNSLNLSNAQPVAMDVDPDGMADVAILQPSSVQWLRAIEKSTTPAKMVLSSDYPHVGQDTTPPSVPGAFTVTPAAGLVVNLSWQASTDDSGGDVLYRVFRDGRGVGVKQTGMTYVDHVTSGGNHSYQVKAYDAAGNMSSTNKVTVKAFH